LRWDSPLKTWEEAFRQYPEAIRVRSLTSASRSELRALEDEVQKLVTTTTARDPPHVLADELSSVTGWKLRRGKFRPRLQALVGSNNEDRVKTCSTGALEMLAKNDLQGAMAALEELRGVGPATASAVLAAVRPDLVAFMSDEAMLEAPTLGGHLAYTDKAFLMYMSDIRTKVKELREGPSAQKQDWVPASVERALYASAVLSTQDHDGSAAQPSSARRKRRRL